jgi:urease accessory protein
MNAATPALLQLTSPALPIGAFSYSSGLEMAIERGWVHDAMSCEAWISDALHGSVLRWDVPLWAALFRAWAAGDDVVALNTQAITARETAELRSEHTQMGHALRRWIIDVLGAEVSPAQVAALRAMEPISMLTTHSLASHAMGVTLEQGALSYAFGFVENQVMAASKAVPLGQTDAQRLLRRLTKNLEADIARAVALEPADWSSAAPLVAIASMQHETQYTRLFRS